MTDEETGSVFNKIAERWVDEFRVPRSTDVPDSVYHYTDASGLSGMLSTHSIWATDHRFLNDKSEAAHTRTIVQEEISKIDNSKAYVRRFLQKVIEFNNKSDNDQAFVFSFSEERDNLSQWRGYAREGKGFTLGFDASILHSVSRPDESPYTFTKVEYNDARQRVEIRKILHDFVEALEKQTPPKRSNENNILEAANAATWTIDNKALLNKHSSFSSENEWRLVSYSEADELTKVRTSDLYLIPYKEMVLHDKGTLPISSVGIGPGFDSPAAVKDAVTKLAKNNGYDVDIYIANTPYRKM